MNQLTTWNLKHPTVNGCFNWMITNHYIKHCCFNKHLLKNGCLGYQVLIVFCKKTNQQKPVCKKIFFHWGFRSRLGGGGGGGVFLQIREGYQHPKKLSWKKHPPSTVFNDIYQKRLVDFSMAIFVDRFGLAPAFDWQVLGKTTEELTVRSRLLGWLLGGSCQDS